MSEPQANDDSEESDAGPTVIVFIPLSAAQMESLLEALIAAADAEHERRVRIN
jgi:hypothetical protein